MIDIEHARKRFDEYLTGYDETDDKIQLKIIHTFCVLDAADEISRGEGFSEEDHQLAVLIALLHDIGRFEQLKEFHSFDDRLMDHALFGVKVLFEDGLIGEFIADRQYDDVIRKAIQYHNLYVLPEGMEDRELLHARIIRDADKLDNFRVKETVRLETLFDTPEELVELEMISPHIMERMRNRQCIVSRERVTHMDSWVSYLAFIFDLNFASSFRWIGQRDYINKNINRVTYRNPQTRQDMEEIRGICENYVGAFL